MHVIRIIRILPGFISPPPDQLTKIEVSACFNSDENVDLSSEVKVIDRGSELPSLRFKLLKTDRLSLINTEAGKFTLR